MDANLIIAALTPEFGRPGLSTRRAISADEVREAVAALPGAKKRVRVYSSAGFVPNSYRNKCLIQYVEAALHEDGEWRFSTGWTGAQRKRGWATRVVVQ
jgi:hypothetical protein